MLLGGKYIERFGYYVMYAGKYLERLDCETLEPVSMLEAQNRQAFWNQNGGRKYK